MAYAVVGSLEALLPAVGIKDTGAAQASGGDDLDALPVDLPAALWHDVGRFAAQWVVMAILAVIYLTVQFYMPVDGCPVRRIWAGQKSDAGRGAAASAMFRSNSSMRQNSAVRSHTPSHPPT